MQNRTTRLLKWRAYSYFSVPLTPVVPAAERPFVAFRRYLPGEFAPTGIMHVEDRVVGWEMLFGPEAQDQFRHSLSQITPPSSSWKCSPGPVWTIRPAVEVRDEEGKVLRQAWVPAQ
jgi:hypothetical protein